MNAHSNVTVSIVSANLQDMYCTLCKQIKKNTAAVFLSDVYLTLKEGVSSIRGRPVAESF